MNRVVVPTAAFAAHFESKGFAAPSLNEIKTEAVRKAIHFLIALSPSMAAINYTFTVIFLMTGTLFYACLEYLRLSGVQVPVISRITQMATRPKDDGKFVLGPVTLGLGALLALLLYPSPASVIAIYALAFGDGFASLVGKLFGTIRPPFMQGKSIEGSTACFIAVLASTFLVTRNIEIALICAVAATAVEALPLNDYDNIALPVSVGFIAYLLL
jgi:dolichol kinase